MPCHYRAGMCKGTEQNAYIAQHSVGMIKDVGQDSNVGDTLSAYCAFMQALEHVVTQM